MKNTKNILKEVGVLLIATVLILTTVSVTANTNDVQKAMKSYENVELRATEPIIYPTINKGVFSDSFEFYPDFVLDFSPWTQFDGDGSGTYGMIGYEWPNVYYEGAFMIFNPSTTTPPLSGHLPHTGEKYASCWDAVTPPNDDWLFSPQFHVDEDGMLSFWGRSLNDAYGLEEIEYGISTTDTDPSSFTIVSGPVIEVPTVWTEYTYSLTSYIGEDIYIGIHVVSFDHFAFFLDDFTVTGVNWTPPDPDLFCEGSLHFGNVSGGATVTDSFTVMNVGGGLLDWEITKEPSWGTWTFDPDHGDDLAPGDPVTVQVTGVAPKKKGDYTSQITITNMENPEDTCTIDISMTTPRNKPFNMNMLFLIFLEQHPHLFPILRLMLGL
jgi:hypothetical protein